MKKIWLLSLGLILLAATVWAFPGTEPYQGFTWSTTATMEVASDNTTVTITVPTAARGKNNYKGRAWLLVPASLESGTVSLSASVNGSTFFTLYYFGGSAPIAYTTGAITGGVALPLPDLSPFSHLKVTTGAEQTADKTFTLVGD